MRLNVRQYHYGNNKAADRLQFGIIPTEAAKVFPEVVNHHVIDESGKDFVSISNSSVAAVAIKAIQE